MGKEICFFIPTPLTARDYKRFGVELLQSQGFKVTFLDITRLMNQEYLSNYQPELASYKNVMVFESRKDILTFFEKNNKDMFVIIFSAVNWCNLFVYQALKKHKINYAVFHANAYPSPDFIMSNEHKTNIVNHIKKLTKIKNFNKHMVYQLLRMKMALFQKLPNYLLGIRPPQYVFAGGFKSLVGLSKRWGNVKKMWAHTLDYDLYLDIKLKDRLPLVTTDYALFLDEYLPFHPDCFVTGGPPIPYKNPKTYYDHLNKMFDIIENKFGIPVVIAANPRSQYQSKPDCFNGRQIVKDATPDLIAHASCVFLHGSTSVNCAVLFRKPIIFLMPLEIENDGFYLPHYLALSRELNKQLLDMDMLQNIDIQKETQVDEKIYSSFVEAYIKTLNSPKKYFWEIVANTIGGKNEHF